MKKNNTSCLILGLLFSCLSVFSQDWNFKLKSKVELRNWNLSSRALKNASLLNGASIKLYKGSALVLETISEADGSFEISIPPNGEYTLEISYEGQKPKKFAVSTKDNPDKNNIHTKPTVSVVGLIMTRYVKDAQYLGMSQPKVHIEYNSPRKEQEVRNYSFKSNIYDAEYLLIQKFCTANKLGDIALQQKDYLRAKAFYRIATDIIDGEPYPKEQLKKAEEGLKAEMAAEKSQRKRKTEQNDPKPPIVVKPTNGTSVKKPVETNKSSRKTRMTLGK